MNQKYTFLLSICVTLFLVVACSQQNVPEKSKNSKVKIGFLVKQPEETWFIQEWKFAQRCADKYGFDLIKIGATDGEKVLSAIDNLAASGAKGFVICTPDERLGPAVMAKAESYGMKVITVDDQFIGADGKFMDTPYMGISARAIGELVGKAVYEEYKKREWNLQETGVCAITYEQLNTAKERTDGAADSLIAAGFPAEKIYRVPMKIPDVPSAFDAANIVLTQHPEIQRWLIFSMNDEGVLGAVRATENRGFTAETVIAVGIGGNSALPEFEKPTPTGLYATCLISPLRHGYESTENLYRWITTGTPPPPDVRTSGIIITRDNYQQVMKEQGLLD